MQTRSKQASHTKVAVSLLWTQEAAWCETCSQHSSTFSSFFLMTVICMDCFFWALLLLTLAQRDINENRCTLNDLTGKSHREPFTMKHSYIICVQYYSPQNSLLLKACWNYLDLKMIGWRWIPLVRSLFSLHLCSLHLSSPLKDASISQ